MSTSPNPRLTRLSAWNARRPWVVDGAVVAAIVAIGSLRGPDDVARPASWAFTVALALPLLWRRRWPAGVFAVIAVIALAQWAADVRAFGDSALLIALYTVAATQPMRTTLAAAAVVELGIALALARWAPDGQPLNAFVALSGLATAAGVLGVNVQHRHALLATLRERAARLEAERDQQGRLAAAAERSRIAREMHDIVAHNVSVMIALADGASFAVRDAPDDAEVAMRSAARTGRQALTEMRRLLGILRDDGEAERTPQPGIAQLDALVDQMRAAGVPTTLSVTGSPTELAGGGLQLAAYRIVQEALTNTLKHAGPGVEATVTLRWSDDRLAVAVANTGLSSGAPAPEGGGLRGMRERAAVYDGTVEAGPAQGGGWRVAVELVHGGVAAPIETLA